jgi:hypothetical protein
MALYKNTSPYYNTKLLGNYLGPLVNRPIPKLSDDVLFTINLTYARRPDLLAFDMYGDSKLWWVFAARNPNTIVDPLNDFVEGVKIYLPKIETLKTALGV